MSFNRSSVRFAAVMVACLLSSRQGTLFDCNKLPAASWVGGVATLLALYGVGEALHNVATSARSGRDKLAAVTRVLLVGVAAVAAAGFFTVMTHLCP